MKKQIKSVFLAIIMIVGCVFTSGITTFAGHIAGIWDTGDNVKMGYRNVRQDHSSKNDTYGLGGGHWNNTSLDGHGDWFDVSGNRDCPQYLIFKKGHESDEGISNANISRAYFYASDDAQCDNGYSTGWIGEGRYEWGQHEVAIREGINGNKPRKNGGVDKWLAMAMAMTLGSDGDWDSIGVPMNSVFPYPGSGIQYGSDYVDRAISSIVSGLYYDVYVIESSTGYIILNPNHDWGDTTVWAFGNSGYDYQYAFNQTLVTILGILDSYLHYEATGGTQTLADTTTSDQHTAKEQIANRYHDLHVYPSALQPNGIWSGKLYSGDPGSNDHLEGGSSGLNPYAWADGYPWRSGGVIEIRKTAEDQSVNGNGRTVAGITFVARNTNTGNEYFLVTDANGYAKVEGVVPGQYTITEVKPAKYR